MSSFDYHVVLPSLPSSITEVYRNLIVVSVALVSCMSVLLIVLTTYCKLYSARLVLYHSLWISNPTPPAIPVVVVPAVN